MFNSFTKQQKFGQNMKKKPPPRPPPPNLNKLRSKSAWNLNQVDNNVSLIEWSPPGSPRVTDRVNHYGGSAFSSFSSSTSSLASSKKSYEYESAPINTNPWSPPAHATSQVQNSMFYVPSQTDSASNKAAARAQTSAPTIIRAQPQKSAFKLKETGFFKEPAAKSTMPNLPPPPSPPKGSVDIVTPYGVALFDFPASQPGDLALQTNDIVILIRRVNEEWLYGRVDDKEGIFPSSFIEVLVPLPDDKYYATALYDFKPQMIGDLELKAGCRVKIIKRISDEWVFGESNGASGQFPANYVDRVPTDI